MVPPHPARPTRRVRTPSPAGQKPSTAKPHSRRSPAAPVAMALRSRTAEGGRMLLRRIPRLVALGTLVFCLLGAPATASTITRTGTGGASADEGSADPVSGPGDLTALLQPVREVIAASTGAGTGARAAPGSGVWPLDPRPRVVAGFDPPATRWGPGHRGVDLAGHPGQQVRAARAGRVVFAGSLAGRGVVVVDHGPTRTTYEPVSADVSIGDRVAAGAVIGRLQLFGSHCFPRWCLHWGLIQGRDHYLDPLLLVGAAPVVLLPVRGP